MSGVYTNIIGQDKKPGVYTGYQLLVVSSRKVCATDAVVEQYIPADEDPVFFVIESHVTGGMTWYEKHRHTLIAEFYIIPFLQICVGGLVFIQMKTVAGRVYLGCFQD